MRSLSRALLLAAAAAFVSEAAGASLRARRGDDDGDDGGGGMGGLAGALSGMMGGGGGGGAVGDDGDDDDPNMVGGKKKKSAGKGSGGVDLAGLESGLATGGVGQLTAMLNAMRMGQGHSDNHIKKGPNGEDMYDFRDLDDGPTTTMKPIITREAPPVMPQAPMFEMPAMPTISLPGKGGKLKGLKKAEALAAAAAARQAGDKMNPGSLTVWPPAPVAQPRLSAAPAVPQAFAVSSAPMSQAMMMPGQMMPGQMMPGQMMPGQMMPGQMMPGQMMPGQMMPVASAGAGGLVQGLAAMRQSMDMLMSQYGGGAAPPGQASTGVQAAQLDQLSQSFKAEESKMDKRVEVLEGENSAMRTQLDEQATEIKTLQEGRHEAKGHKAKSHKVKVHKVKAHKAKDVIAKKTLASDKVVAAKDVATKKSSASSKVAVATKKASAPADVKQIVVPPPVPPPVATKKVAITKKAKTSVYASAPWDATFNVHLDGKAGGKQESFTVRVHPEWAPEGAKRFQDMLQAGVLSGERFFRVMPGFMVQWGVPASPKVANKWEHKKIRDDPVVQSNTRGMMTFATSGPNTRTTQMFINYANNDFLDKQGFSPFAEVLGDGMKVVGSIQSKYKERPNQGKIHKHGNKYLAKHFPDLSFVDHVDSTLTSSPSAVAGLIQDSATAGGKKTRRYGNIATFYHHKVKVAE